MGAASVGLAKRWFDVLGWSAATGVTQINIAVVGEVGGIDEAGEEGTGLADP